MKYDKQYDRGWIYRRLYISIYGYVIIRPEMVKKIVDKYMNFLRTGTMTQPAVDGDVLDELQTGCSVRAKLAMEIHRVDLEIPPPVGGPSWTEMWLASEDISALFATMAHYAIDALIAYQEQNAVGASIEAGLQSYTIEFDPPLLYAFTSIFFGGRSAATGAANIFSGRVGFTWKTLTDAEFVEALEAWR